MIYMSEKIPQNKPKTSAEVYITIKKPHNRWILYSNFKRFFKLFKQKKTTRSFIKNISANMNYFCDISHYEFLKVVIRRQTIS